jgi:outer membrane lipoprotein-sorting protein
MKMQEKKLSKYIDRLNGEMRPKEHGNLTESEEFEKLAETVRKIRVLREPDLPGEDFKERLVASLEEKIGEDAMKTNKQIQEDETKRKDKAKVKLIRRIFIGVTAAAAAAVLIFIAGNLPPLSSLTGTNTDIAYAMEQALKEVKAYHGMIEAVETNELGERMLQSKREIWADQEGNYYLKELEGFSAGMITVNDTKKEWQIRPEEKKVYLSAAFPDPYRFTFELGSEVQEVQKAASVKEIGDETISGRETTVLEIIPDGGEAYRLWVDKETDLPLKKQSAMQNSLQITISYTEIEYADQIPKELLAYQLPEGFEEVDMYPEQIVTTIEEAESLTHFTPVFPETTAEGFTLEGISVLTDSLSVKLYYEAEDLQQMAVVLQKTAKEELNPATGAILGTVNNTVAEIRYHYEGISGINSIRWQEDGLEYTVFGNISEDTLVSFAEGLSRGEVKLPQTEDVTVSMPQIEVPFDMTVEENEQKSVDAGHSPWKLDPAFVTQVFASLQISPEGITGEYPIAYEDIDIVENNGIEAKAKINSEKSVAEYVYLKRLTRQDDTGIWTVVGYDPAR